MRSVSRRFPGEAIALLGGRVTCESVGVVPRCGISAVQCAPA